MKNGKFSTIATVDFYRNKIVVRQPCRMFVGPWCTITTACLSHASVVKAIHIYSFHSARLSDADRIRWGGGTLGVSHPVVNKFSERLRAVAEIVAEATDKGLRKAAALARDQSMVGLCRTPRMKLSFKSDLRASEEDPRSAQSIRQTLFTYALPHVHRMRTR